jgi:hypothetical protein
MPLVILLGSLTGCNTLGEPDADVCVIVDNLLAHCIPVKGGKEYDLLLSDMVGYMAVSPDDYGKIKKHHDELHKKLKGKR